MRAAWTPERRLAQAMRCKENLLAKKLNRRTKPWTEAERRAWSAKISSIWTPERREISRQRAIRAIATTVDDRVISQALQWEVFYQFRQVFA